MGRTDSFIGLHEKARKFLDKNAQKHVYTTYDENGNLVERKEVFDICDGKYVWHSMFGTSHKLNGYTLKSGQRVYEKVQLEPWFSGPCIFTALVDEDGVWINETLWDENEVWDMLS